MKSEISQHIVKVIKVKTNIGIGVHELTLKNDIWKEPKKYLFTNMDSFIAENFMNIWLKISVIRGHEFCVGWSIVNEPETKKEIPPVPYNEHE